MLSLAQQRVTQRVLHSIRFNTMQCIHSSHGLRANQMRQTLDTRNAFHHRLSRLETSLRRIGKITVSDVNQCLQELTRNRRVRPTTSQSLLLIRSCGSLVTDESQQTRKDLCQTMFETLSQTSELDISHYNQLLRVYVENGFDFDAIDFLEKMQSKGVDPNRVTFILMIQRFCQLGNISEAIRLLEHMRNKEMPISESVFNSLIVGYGKAGDLQTAHQTIDMMKSSGVEPSVDTYTSLLCAYAFNIQSPESEAKINEIIAEAKAKEIEFSEKDFFKVIKTIALVDSDSKLLDQILNKIDKTIQYNKECLNVVNDLLFENRVDVALRLYETMEAPEQQLKQRTVGNPVIRGMINANISPKTVIEFCERLEANGKNEFAIKNATELALSHANASDCRAYLKRLSRDEPLKVHYFFPVIVKCQNENEILDVLSEDLSSFSGSSYTQLIELFMDYVWPKNILDVQTFLEKCKLYGFSYTITFNSLIRHHINVNRIDEAVRLMSSPNYSSVNLVKRDLLIALTDAVLRVNPNINQIVRALQMIYKNPNRSARSPEVETNDPFGQFLLSIIRSRKYSESLLNEILKTYHQLSVRVSEASLQAIRDRVTLSDENDDLLAKLKSSDDLKGIIIHSLDDITRPRKEMTIEELEGHLIELRSKGLNTRGVLRSLLMAYCRRTKYTDESNNDILVNAARNRVNQIVSELNESDHEFTNAMHAMLMEFYVNCGDIQIALEVKNKITKEFEIDCYKIINFATLYVKNNEINKGIDLIREENSRKSDAFEGEEGNTQQIRSKDMSIFRLLNSLIEAKADLKLLREVFDLCIDFSSVAPTAVMAGPIIKYLILQEDYSEALNEFLEFAEKYRITPWKNQLVRYFLENGDQISLQKVIDASDKIHGEMNTIMDLAAVCVETGKLKQAKKLLDTPGLRVRQIKIDSICDHFIKEDKLDELEQFIRSSRNVFDINRDRMLYHLIRGCIKTESADKALNCWTLMQEQDIQPSDQTLILLANYLEQKNITVPFAVPPTPIPKPVVSNESFRQDQTYRKPMDDLLNKFNIALKESDIDRAMAIKNELESEGKSLLMSQNCSLIEALLNADRIDEGFAISESLLASKLFPSPRIIRYLYLKLSTNGDYDRLERLRPILPEFLVQNNSFTNSLSIAYINSGKAEELIENHLLQMKPFPLGGFLRALELRPDLEERLVDIANELIRESDFHLPLNMVWINCMKKGRFDDAKRIYESCPKLKDFLLFSSLLDSIRENKNIVLAQNLIETVSKSNLTPKSIGITYSALIDAYIDTEQISTAEDVVVNQVVNNTTTRIDPKSETKVKLLDIEHLNRPTLSRLTKAIREKEKREPKFSALNNRSSAPTSSDGSLSDSSSDDEVIDVKNK